MTDTMSALSTLRACAIATLNNGQAYQDTCMCREDESRSNVFIRSASLCFYLYDLIWKCINVTLLYYM